MLDLSPPEIKALEERAIKEVANKVRRALFTLSTECRTSLDLTILSALGVDVDEKLLQIFVEESRRLLKPQEQAGGPDAG